MLGVMEDFSIELIPREVGAPHELRELLPEGSRVYLTWLPGPDIDHTVTAARRVAEAGLRPVPHIAARDLRSEDELVLWLRRLGDEAGVEAVLVIAGGGSRPRGPFESSLDLLRTGRLEEAGVRSIGVAGYPEGTPVASPEVVRDLLREKIEYACAAGLELSVVSQFCFDGGRIVSWIEELRTAGVDAPVRVGFAGVTSLERLIRFSARCGIGASARVIRKEGRNILRVTRVKTPGKLVLEVARAARRGNLAAKGVSAHLYSLGAFRPTAEWCRAVAEGRFEVVGDDIVVQDPPLRRATP